MKRVSIFFSIILLLILLIWQSIYLPKSFDAGKNILFTIEKGQGDGEIAASLEEQGLIKSDIAFRLYGLFRAKSRGLKAGTYELSPSMNVPKILKKIASGDIVKETITIIEGWNLRDIAWDLENKGMFQAEELFELIGFPAVNHNQAPDLPKPKNFSQNYNFLADKPKNISLEGYLFPDTYSINRVDGIEEIAKKILDNFDKKLSLDLREEIKSQGKSIFEIITMASMLEKEVKTFEDKQIVSGILWKRLNIGMPLQVDAAITYITGKKNGRVFITETKIDSPYNTYKYQGLPLGPICNPGIDSIRAAIYPKNSGYWYYLSKPDGATVFSETLEEHNWAKARYLR